MKVHFSTGLFFTGVVFMTCFLFAPPAMAGDELMLYDVTTKPLKGLPDIKNYAGKIIGKDKIKNFTATRETNFFRLETKKERIKIYPESGFFRYALKGEKYKVYLGRKDFPSTDDMVRVARTFVANNIPAPGSGGSRWYIHNVQAVKNKAVDVATGEESLSKGNTIVIFRRKIAGRKVLGDGNLASIFVDPDMQVVAYDYQWDRLRLKHFSSVLGKKEIEKQCKFTADELVYICSGRYSSDRALTPAYIGNSTTNQLEIRDAISGDLIDIREVED